MDRSDDIVLPTDTDWLRDDDVQAVCRAVSDAGHAIYFVGGCVRDALLHLGGADIDMSTDAEPSKVTRVAEAAGLKVVPTGIDHGTVTVVAGGKGFEVTTFRRDVETDGRRAVVSYSTDIAEDALRRDFTLNALYATPEGRIVDPLDGLDDCLNRRIRFIEDAGTRIREDYLRILRYFRFHAWYSAAEEGFDAEALDAIAQNADGLETLSAERVGAELVKLLASPDPARAVAVMRQTGCLGRVLPGSDDTLLGPVVHLEATVATPPDPMLRLAALGGENVADRLRLSRADKRHLDHLTTAGFGAMPLAEVAYRLGTDVARGAAVLQAALAKAPLAAQDLRAIKAGAAASFPVSAKDLMPEFSGKALGDRLAAIERRWIASGFALSREELLTKG